LIVAWPLRPATGKALVRRTPAAGRHGLGLVDGNEQHLVLVGTTMSLSSR
jgi:hypothetical protein